jgi:hypothetical protein
VEIAQGALLEDHGGLRADRDNAVGKAPHYFRNALDEVGRIEPSLAQFV